MNEMLGALIILFNDFNNLAIVHAGNAVCVRKDTVVMCDDDHGAVRRARGANGGVALAIAFPILSADQEDAIHNAVLRALVRGNAIAMQLPLLVFEPRR